MRVILALSVLVACDTSTGDVEDSGANFCQTLDDGDAVWVEDASDAGANSGSLELRVITDQAEDPHDPYYVAYRAYSLEPAETGGVQTTGQTNGDGLVQKTLGVGTWNFEATWSRGSVTCMATMSNVAITEGQTTHACVVLTCPVD